MDVSKFKLVIYTRIFNEQQAGVNRVSPGFK
jgi:hypothetical protein